MAEDNPKIQIKSPKKPINNCREVYFAENEKNILGPRGFKFALGNDFSKKIKADKMKKYDEFYIDTAILPDISNYNKNYTKLVKSKSQTNINSNSNLDSLTSKNNNSIITVMKNQPLQINRYKNTSIDIPFSNKYSFLSLSSPKNKNITKIYDEINISNLRKNYILRKSYVNNINKINGKIPEIKHKKLNKIHKFNGLKIRPKNHSIKSYFKGVESVFIYPEQIYGVLNDYKKIKDQKNSFDVYENKIREKIEQNNEFKEDQKGLLFEEKAKENLINSKDFYNYLINREYFYQTQINKNKNLFKEKDSSEEKEKFKNKMNYLKKIAFTKDNISKNSINGMNENNSKEDNETNSSKNEENNMIKKKIEDENIEKVRIDGKLYIFKDQMDQIARKILNKCKVYNELK